MTVEIVLSASGLVMETSRLCLSALELILLALVLCRLVVTIHLMRSKICKRYGITVHNLVDVIGQTMLRNLCQFLLGM